MALAKENRSKYINRHVRERRKVKCVVHSEWRSWGGISGDLREQQRLCTTEEEVKLLLVFPEN